MFLKEFEGRSLFRKYDIKVAPGVLISDKISSQDDLHSFLLNEPNVNEFVIKAQLLSGKRGKSGGIIFSKRNELIEKVDAFLGEHIKDEEVHEILIQERLNIEQEFYLGVTLDRSLRQFIFIFSCEGGIEIEEIANSDPRNIFTAPINNAGTFDDNDLEALIKMCKDKGLPDGISSEVVTIAQKLFDMCIKEESILSEINPLILTKDGAMIAADSKVILDNNSLFRHPEMTKKIDRGASKIEHVAHKNGLAYVELEGNIAVIGNGAGLVMATLDSINEYGGAPANFCDVGGGASSDMMKKAIEIVLQKSGVTSLLINIFGGITHCDEISKGVISFIKDNKINIPIVVRVVGTNQKEAHVLLDSAGITTMNSFEEAIKKVVSLTKNHAN